MASVSLNTNSGILTVAAGATRTVTVTVGSANLLAVAFQAGGNFGFAVPKYNGSAGTDMTQLAGLNVTTREAYMHYYANPATGSIGFYFNNSTGSQTVWVLVALFADVDLSNISAGSNTASGSAGTSPNVTVSHTYKSGQLALGSMGVRLVGTPFNTTSNMTSLGRASQASFGYRTAETDGTTLLNNSTDGDSDWVAVGAVLNPSISGGSNIIWWFKKLLEKRRKLCLYPLTSPI